MLPAICSPIDARQRLATSYLLGGSFQILGLRTKKENPFP